jgi:hypothetical protein
MSYRGHYSKDYEDFIKSFCNGNYTEDKEILFREDDENDESYCYAEDLLNNDNKVNIYKIKK